MPEEKLRQSIRDLRREMERLEITDTAAREHLGQLLAGIEDNLNSGDGPSQRRDLARELQDTVKTLEMTHPKVTGILNEIIAALVNLGI